MAMFLRCGGGDEQTSGHRRNIGVAALCGIDLVVTHTSDVVGAMAIEHPAVAIHRHYSAPSAIIGASIPCKTGQYLLTWFAIQFRPHSLHSAECSTEHFCDLASGQILAGRKFKFGAGPLLSEVRRCRGFALMLMVLSPPLRAGSRSAFIATTSSQVCCPNPVGSTRTRGDGPSNPRLLIYVLMRASLVLIAGVYL